MIFMKTLLTAAAIFPMFAFMLLFASVMTQIEVTGEIITLVVSLPMDTWKAADSIIQGEDL